MRLGAAVLLLLVACGHSDPYPLANQGAIGPLTSGTESRLTSGSGSNATWSQDGRSIVYAFGARPPAFGDSIVYNPISGRMVDGDSSDFCARVLPAGGGSSLNDVCDYRLSQRDSANAISEVALSNEGHLLYVESVTLYSRGVSAPPIYPLFHQFSLWIADTGHRFAPRAIATLYRDHLGVAVVDSTALNWLTQITWTGPAEFLALAQNVPPPDPAFRTRPVSIVHGVIGDTATMTPIAGSDSVAHFASVANGQLVVVRVNDTLNRVFTLPASGGTRSLLTTIPAAIGRRIVDLSCQLAHCIVLTNESDASHRSILWAITPALPAAPTQVFVSPHTLSSAKLSPTAAAVVAMEGGPLFLISIVFP